MSTVNGLLRDFTGEVLFGHSLSLSPRLAPVVRRPLSGGYPPLWRAAKSDRHMYRSTPPVLLLLTPDARHLMVWTPNGVEGTCTRFHIKAIRQHANCFAVASTSNAYCFRTACAFCIVSNTRALSRRATPAYPASQRARIFRMASASTATRSWVFDVQRVLQTAHVKVDLHGRNVPTPCVTSPLQAVVTSDSVPTFPEAVSMTSSGCYAVKRLAGASVCPGCAVLLCPDTGTEHKLCLSIPLYATLMQNVRTLAEGESQDHVYLLSRSAR